MKLPSFAQDGLHFKCTACGKCCINHGEYDQVYLTKQDLQLISNHFKMSQKEFRQKFALQEDGEWALKSKTDRCQFLNTHGQCDIYSVRPLQCRTFPFWPENLNKEVWKNEIERDCPGAFSENQVGPDQIKTYIQWDLENSYPFDDQI